MNSIIHVNKAFFPEHGGVETVCRQYAKLSKKCFGSVSVLTINSKKGFFSELYRVDNIDVRSCGYQFKISGHRFSFLFIYYLVKATFLKTVIHTHDPFPLATSVYSVFKPQSHIITYHSDILRQRFLKPIFDVLRLHVIRRAKIVTVTSSGLRDNSDILKYCKNSDIEIIPIYLENPETYLHSATSKLTAVFDNNKYLNQPFFLMLGRMNYYKGLDQLFFALDYNRNKDKVNDVPIVIAGVNSDKFSFFYSQSLSKNFKNVVRLEQRLSEKDKIFLLQKCSALLFPSNHKTEAFGIVQLEALAAKKPVVNFNIKTGVPQVSLDGVTGKTFEIGDLEAFSELFLSENKVFQSLNKLIPNIEGHLETNFSKLKTEEKLEKIYLGLIGRPN